MITVNSLKTTAFNVVFPKRKKNALRGEGLKFDYASLAAALIPFD